MKSRTPHPILTIALASLLTLVPPLYAEDKAEEFSPESLEWFEREVRPLLAEHCFSCHSQSSGNRKGGLWLDSRESMLTGGDSGPAIVPGDLSNSLLIESIRRESFEMPPEKALSKSDQRILERWINQGAPWPHKRHSAAAGEDWLAERHRTHWAWRSITAQPVPEIDDDAWSANAIDKFILRRLRDEQLTPADSCEPAALLRRLSFDLTGLPPDPAKNGSRTGSETDYRRQVEQLIASPQFGVRWGRHWLDLVRYAETLGHEFDYPIHHAWRYRDAIMDAFNTDLPYDRLVVEHLAGDQLNDARHHPLTDINQSLAMTGFWWLGDSVHAPTDIRNDWATRVENQIDVVSKTFMGMTVACVRCHDHKFDAISVDDYYGLAGIIESSRRVYALTDPQQTVAKYNTRIRRQLHPSDEEARRQFSRSEVASADAALAWLHQYMDTLQSMNEQRRRKELAASSPFYPLNALFSQSPVAEQLSKLRPKLRAAAAKFDRWLEDSPRWATFSGGVPQGWRVDAVSPIHPALLTKTPYVVRDFWSQVLSTPGSFDWFSSNLPLPHRLGTFASQRLGLAQRVNLQSPVFEVTHDMVCLKMRGQDVHSSLVIDNYFMSEFHGLLFKDIRKPIDQSTDSGWVSHRGDLNKYVGETAFLSLEDSGQGWFEIEEVRFANQSPPAQPSATALDVLDQQISTREELLSAMASRIAQAFTAVASRERSHEEPAKATSNAESNESTSGAPLQSDVALIRQLMLTSQRNELPLANLKELADHTHRLHDLDKQSPQPTILLAAADSTPRDTAIAVRGNPHQLGSKVPRSCFVSITNQNVDEIRSSGRLELASSLVASEHPLTARVIVNRVWHHLMGRGLVHSTDNLGVLGGRPTHPMLLDYLAAEFTKHNWSLKWLVREIALSKTYRLSSTATPDQLELDADGSLWSHRSVRRLSAEAIRDTLLATAGSLDHQLAGKSVPIHLNDQMTGRGRPKNNGPLDGGNRRSAYVEVRRNFLDPFLLAFDFPMPSTATGNRTQSNVPAQALGMLNDPLVAELSNRWALSLEAIADPSQRIRAMFARAFGREARDEELQQCLQFIEQTPENAWQQLAHVLVNSKEFSFLP